MFVFDRIVDKQVAIEAIETPILIGRYLDANGKYLVPCKDSTEKIDGMNISFAKNEFIHNNESLLSSSIISISHELKSLQRFEDVKSIHTMLRNFDEKLEVNDYERFLSDKLFHIEELCRQPAYHLSRDITKVNIARAKRIPVRSINHLAAHSEDWSRRRIRGVEPKMILSETIEYDLQIYENKVTAKLIDKLLYYCNTRIENDISVVEKLMDKVSEILQDIKTDGNAISYWYKKRERDYKRLGLIVQNVEKSNSQLEKLRKFILKIQSRLFALLSSKLYMENKNNILSSDSIEQTNLFDNHQHYRYVKILWHKSFTNKAIDCTEIIKENRLITASFADYAYTLIIRSLANLGFIQKERMGTYSFQLVHEIFEFPVEITKNDHDIIKMQIEEKDLLFIPILDVGDCVIEQQGSNKYLLVQKVQKIQENILKISPDDVNSEERITKVIFEHLLNRFIENYNYPLDSQVISQYPIIKDWFLKNNDIATDRGSDKLELYLNGFIDERKMQDFNKEIKNLPNHKQRDRQNIELETLGMEMKKSRMHFEKYFHCLGCGNKDTRSLEVTGKGFIYSCSNTGCEVSYGIDSNDNIFYKVKNYREIKGDLEDSIGYENIG